MGIAAAKEGVGGEVFQHNACFSACDLLDETMNPNRSSSLVERNQGMDGSKGAIGLLRRSRELASLHDVLRAIYLKLKGCEDTEHTVL